MSNLAILSVAVPSILIIVVAVFVLFRRKGKSSQSPKPLTVGLASTRERLVGRLTALFGREELGDDFWNELEATLIEADVGIDVTSQLLEGIRQEKNSEEVREKLSKSMLDVLCKAEDTQCAATETPHVILVVGVNGVGKTTTIAKLARQYVKDGKRVLLVAGDTFRAAAVDQIKIWGERLGCEVVAQADGADSAAVAFDGVEKARAKGYDVVIIDTAGRLHTKHNLMEELGKVSRVIDKAMTGAPHERLLILDATIGSNGLSQAKQFNEIVNLNSAIVTKLDGTAKGGIVFAVAGELGIPITHIGIGEGMDDLRPFNPQEFVSTILN
ncbi:MAG: signal recognition particle-docking protein FtsY [Deltaproteobacteria bacterium]|jgi:fused signal recognition particle receptor|nr:signal recognition particle-docking protein FtsY [Deltaproteobacteria bacterium]